MGEKDFAEKQLLNWHCWMWLSGHAERACATVSKQTCPPSLVLHKSRPAAIDVGPASSFGSIAQRGRRRKIAECCQFMKWERFRVKDGRGHSYLGLILESFARNSQPDSKWFKSTFVFKTVSTHEDNQPKGLLYFSISSCCNLLCKQQHFIGERVCVCLVFVLDFLIFTSVLSLWCGCISCLLQIQNQILFIRGVSSSSVPHLATQVCAFAGSTQKYRWTHW